VPRLGQFLPHRASWSGRASGVLLDPMRAQMGLERVESARGTHCAKRAREHAIALRDEESHHRGRQRQEWQTWQLSQMYITCRSQTQMRACRSTVCIADRPRLHSLIYRNSWLNGISRGRASTILGLASAHRDLQYGPPDLLSRAKSRAVSVPARARTDFLGTRTAEVNDYGAARRSMVARGSKSSRPSRYDQLRIAVCRRAADA
jgi:hypothetical protein